MVAVIAAGPDREPATPKAPAPVQTARATVQLVNTPTVPAIPKFT